MSGRPSVAELADGVRSGDRAAVARAITLVESQREADQGAAGELLDALLPDTGNAIRAGITGVPGVGKSTFIEAIGTRLLAHGHRIAVLAVDPSSGRSGGSILGDKTRMPKLATSDGAFVRPSPTGGASGGVARRTREAMLVCEAAGFDVVLVETVGVGQSELAVAAMVDTFVLLALAGAGDELQGIKRGVMELADVVAITKADGENTGAADRARSDAAAALHVLRSGTEGWRPPVLTCSAHAGTGIDGVWQAVLDHRASLGSAGIAARRRDQALHWFDAAVDELLRRRVLGEAGRRERIAQARARVAAGEWTPTAAAWSALGE